MVTKNKSLGSKAFDITNHLIMVFIIIVTAYPLYYVLIASFSDPTALAMSNKAILLPIAPLTTQAYELVFENPMLVRGYANTIFILVVGTIVNMIMTIMGAYFLACKGIMLQKYVVIFIIIPMYFSGGIIPSYLNIKELGMLDTHLALIIPGAISIMNMIIMRTAFQTIPDSLTESAKLDGASHFKTLTKIMIPLAIPTIVVLVLYYGVAHWNSWFSASIYLLDRKLFPLQLILREILVENNTTDMMSGTDMGDMAQLALLIKYALIVVSTAPILLIYPFLQKFFVKGVMVGAIKG